MKAGTASKQPAKSKALMEEYAAYLPRIQSRWRAQQSVWEQRRTEAWGAAGRVAAILRREFGTEKVTAFGSMVHTGRFSELSDIDITVAGIRPRVFLEAWAAAGASCPFELDLVDLADCSPALRRLIEQKGIPL